jgi:hypothetical protein
MADEIQAMSIGELREVLADLMDLEGAWGKNLDESKEALIQAGDEYWVLGRVKASFFAGRFVVILEAGVRDA